MNSYYKEWQDTLCKSLSRDPIFIDVLNNFKDKPINVLEIGCARSLSGRYGDGWSSLFWADHILKNGGSLDVCDIDQNCIDNAKILLQNFDKEIKVNFITDDGINVLQDVDKYDIIYLDGSDDPHQMVDQLKLCNLEKNYVFCDDFHTKGSLASKIYPDYILYKLSNGHEMALFGKDIRSKIINL
jgi:hypothetical protein